MAAQESPAAASEGPRAASQGASEGPRAASQGASEGPRAASQGGLVTAAAKRVLATSKGRMRVPLEDLGPALFNRQGLPIRVVGTAMNWASGSWKWRGSLRSDTISVIATSPTPRTH